MNDGGIPQPAAHAAPMRAAPVLSPPTLSPPTLSTGEAWLRKGFKFGNRFMLLMWRLGGLPTWGMANPYSGYILVITHTGRKSGLRRRTPVNFAEVDGDLFCVAGFGAVADWYRNLCAHPQAEVWLPDHTWWRVEAQDITGDITGWPRERRLPIVRQVLINSGFAGRMAGFNPRTMSDAALEAATAAYKVVRLHRTAPQTGTDGPGDLGWVWPTAATILGLLWWRARRKQH